MNLMYNTLAVVLSKEGIVDYRKIRDFLRRFRDPIRVPGMSNLVPRIRENYHRGTKIRENRVPRIREIGSLQILKNNLVKYPKKQHQGFVFQGRRLLLTSADLTLLPGLLRSYLLTAEQQK